MTRHVVQFSGGTGSWYTARRVRDQHGTDNMVLLFADVLTEHPDLYRFLDQAAADIGVPVTRVCEGRTPQQVFRDRKWLGNSRVAQCSHLLKQEPCRQWLADNCDPADTVLYVGIDWTEQHRLPGIERGWAPWKVEAPLCQPPLIGPDTIADALRAAGIEPPELNRLGWRHNNCAGFCVKGGQAQWAHALRVFPEQFAQWEQFEQEMRADLGKDISILRERVNGVTRQLPLTVLRQRVEAQSELFDPDDWGGCGCMNDMDGAA